MTKLGYLWEGDRRVDMGVGDTTELKLAFDSGVCNACAGRTIESYLDDE